MFFIGASRAVCLINFVTFILFYINGGKCCISLLAFTVRLAISVYPVVCCSEDVRESIADFFAKVMFTFESRFY